MLTIIKKVLLAQNSNSAAVSSYQVPKVSLGFNLPNFSQVLTFVIRLFFVVAGLVALLYLLLGAFGWITSGGSKEAIDKAREKIQASIVGLILIFVVLSVVMVIENILGIGLGISREIIFPKLIP